MSSPFHEEFRALRKSRRVTQVQLAEQSGVAQSTISDLERGKDGATLRTLNSLLEALEGHLEVRGDEDKGLGIDALPPRIASIVTRLVQAHPHLSDDTLYLLEAMLKRAERQQQ